MKKDKIFEFIKKVQAISHTGVTYSKDPYALDNYHELLNLSTQMIHEYMRSDVQPYDIYKEVYYPTPQPSVRIIVFQDNRLLMVQEKDSPKDTWTLPGGWCDIGESPVQAAIKEVKEETGFDIQISKFLGIMDRNKYQQSTLYHVYNIVFMAEIVGGQNDPNYEVNKVDFFNLSSLPKLSKKISRDELDVVLQAYKNNEIYFE